MPKILADFLPHKQHNLLDSVAAQTADSLTRPPNAGAERARIVAALTASRGSAPARYKGTAWSHVEASATRSGLGCFFDKSSAEFEADLKDDASRVTPKGDGPCFSLAKSSHGGSSDDECLEVYGFLLDQDVHGRAWSFVSEVLKGAGIGHVIQLRGEKAHVSIPFAEPWVVDGSQKADYTRVFGLLINTFGELAGGAFDAHPAMRMLGLTYVYTPRTEGEIVTTIVHEGVGLDLSSFVQCFADELAPEPEVVSAPKPQSRPENAGPFWGIEAATVGGSTGQGYAPTPERVRRAKAYLEKVPPAVEGQGGDRKTLLACIVVAHDFDLDDDDAFEALEDWNARCEPPWEPADLFKKIASARKSANGPVGSKCAREERRPVCEEPTGLAAPRPAWTNRFGDPNRGPLVQFAPAKEGEAGAQPGTDGKFWKQVQPSTALLTREVRQLMDFSGVVAIRKEGTGNRYFEILSNRLVKAIDEDGLRGALTRSLRDLMGQMEPEPRTVTTAVQLLCDRARSELDLKAVRWEGETCFALHEIPRPAEGNWAAHREFIERCGCPRTVMAWVWSCFLPENQTGRESLYLFGPGNDGKSLWSETLHRFLGPAATSSEILKGENRFELANLLDKRLVYFGDTRNPKPIHPKVMREIIAGAFLPYEKKGKDMQVAYFHPRCLFTSNVHFKIDESERAEVTRVRKVLVSPLAGNAGDHGWKDRLIDQLPAFLHACRQVYEGFATPGQDLPITDACRAALASGSDLIAEEFDYLSTRLEFTGNSADFIEAKRLVELFDQARYRSWDRTNAYAWLRSQGATNKGADQKKRVKKIRGVTVAVWEGVREIQDGPFSHATSPPSAPRPEARN